MRQTSSVRKGIVKQGLLAACALELAACAAPQAIVITPVPVSATTQQAELSTLPSEQVIIPTKPVTPLQAPAFRSTARISLTAKNADVRELLPALASAAGISIVLGPDVSGRVSVNLRNVLAIDALQAVIDEAGLSVGTPIIEVPFGPVVFYQLPVNVNTASAATIKVRFGVSDEVAAWVVAARNK